MVEKMCKIKLTFLDQKLCKRVYDSLECKKVRDFFHKGLDRKPSAIKILSFSGYDTSNINELKIKYDDELLDKAGED